MTWRGHTPSSHTWDARSKSRGRSRQLLSGQDRRTRGMHGRPCRGSVATDAGSTMHLPRAKRRMHRLPALTYATSLCCDAPSIHGSHIACGRFLVPIRRAPSPSGTAARAFPRGWSPRRASSSSRY